MALSAPWMLTLVGLLVASPMTCLNTDEVDETFEREAQQVWIRDCASCHGMAGDGRGSEAVALDAPPPDFADPCRQVDPKWIERVILRGGESFGGNAAMRAHHELAHRREVLDALVTHIHSLRSEGECRPRKMSPPIDLDDI